MKDVTDEIVSLTGSLIRFKSTHEHPEEIRNCLEFIADYLKQADIEYRSIEKNGALSLLATPVNGYAPILLMSHIDVVAGPDELFEPKVKNGNLHGRGSLDDKYAAALSLVLMKNRLEKARAAGKRQQDAGVGILITGDEEVGGQNGARHVLSQTKAGFCIALDGGSLDKIIVKEKGILTLRLIAGGKSAHGSRPWLGINAIERICRDYARIKALFQDDPADRWRRTINFSIVRAGSSFNQVPDRAEAVFDIRYTENDDVDALLGEIRSRTEGELIVDQREPLFLAGESPYLDLLKTVATESRPDAEHGASDARFLSLFGIKGIVWGADGDGSQHAVDEHVQIESVGRLYRYIDEFVEQAAIQEIQPTA